MKCSHKFILFVSAYSYQKVMYTIFNGTSFKEAKALVWYDQSTKDTLGMEPKVLCAFEILMTLEILHITTSIAFCCVLLHGENLDIHCWKLYHILYSFLIHSFYLTHRLNENPQNYVWGQIRSYKKVVMILPQVHLRKPCYDFTFL